jgi:PAS domain S-box-containing protein
MKPNTVLFVALLCVLAVFCLTTVWEFALEEAFLSLVGLGYEIESVEDRWEYVATATGAAAIVAAVFSRIAFQAVSRQKQAAKAQHENEKRFQDYTESASEWHWEMGPDLRFSFLSSQYEKSTRIPVENVLGKRHDELASADPSEEHWAKHLSNLAAHRLFRDFEYAQKMGDGSTAYHSMSGKPLYDRNGIFQGYRGTGSNITQRKEAEEALQRAHAGLELRVQQRTAELERVNKALATEITERKRSEAALNDNQQLLHTVIDAIPAMINAKDRRSRYILMNRYQADLYGVAAEDAVGKTATELLNPTYGAYTESRDREVFATGKAISNYEETWHEPSGRTHVFLTTKVPLCDDSGDLTNVVTVSLDITDRKGTEEALRESEERLRQATQLVGLGHWVWDAVEDRCLYCSEENARIHGMSVEDYMTKASAITGEFAMIHPDDRREMKAVFQALRNGREFEKEYRLLTPAGKMRYIREVAKPVFGEGGSVVQEFGTIQEITEQKQIEEQLRQAQKMEAIGQLTGGVAHDFNNLLAVVMVNAELLSVQLGEEDPKIQAVLRAAGRGADLTRQLLAFSRRQPLQPRALDLNVLVQGMREMLSRSLGETIEIRTALDEGLWHALADPGQVENALLNLAINARDAMPDGGTLVIETDNARLDVADAESHPEVAPGDYVVLTVIDSGAGMASNVVEHAFEPFFTTKKVGQGAGLGLSMVYGFAKQSGGHAAIYSEQGHGTTVKFYLPRTEAQDEAPRPLEKEAPRGRGEKVLLVEDDADVRQLAEHLIENLGYRVFTAEDASTALGILDHIPRPDLLLSDVVLPNGLSGPDLAKRLLFLDPGLKIILMSGYPADAAKHMGLLNSDKVLLSKPFSRSQLARALRKALG